MRMGQLESFAPPNVVRELEKAVPVQLRLRMSHSGRNGRREIELLAPAIVKAARAPLPSHPPCKARRGQ